MEVIFQYFERVVLDIPCAVTPNDDCSKIEKHGQKKRTKERKIIVSFSVDII